MRRKYTGGEGRCNEYANYVMVTHLFFLVEFNIVQRAGRLQLGSVNEGIWDTTTHYRVILRRRTSHLFQVQCRVSHLSQVQYGQPFNLFVNLLTSCSLFRFLMKYGRLNTHGLGGKGNDRREHLLRALKRLRHLVAAFLTTFLPLFAPV